jgi:uncharacterized protein YndB with AHSA1/START domain
MNIDTKASLQAQKELLINAPIERVWQILTTINAWATWQNDVANAHLEGRLKAGTRFVWKAGGMNITSILQEVEENKIISWTGVAFGTYAVHVWEFQKIGDTTRVITRESLAGWLPAMIKIFKPTFLEDSLKKVLESLKNCAENNA